jgi:protein-disulfide isomerase
MDPLKPHVPFELAVPISPVDHFLGAQHAPVTVVEYGDFPLEEVHPHALPAAMAAECAGGQDKFWSMHDLLYANQDHLAPKNLHGYAAQLGLDMARYTAEMDDEIYLQRVREHLRSGLDSGVRATPTFFINGRIQDVSFGLRALFDAVESSLHPKK